MRQKGCFKIHRRPQLKRTSVNCIVEFLNPLKNCSGTHP